MTEPTQEADADGRFDLPEIFDAAWEVGRQLIVTLPADDEEEGEYVRTVRIAATRAFGADVYWSSCEERVDARLEGKRRTVWVRFGGGVASGKTETECLQRAIESLAASEAPQPPPAAA